MGFRKKQFTAVRHTGIKVIRVVENNTMVLNKILFSFKNLVSSSAIAASCDASKMNYLTVHFGKGTSLVLSLAICYSWF